MAGGRGKQVIVDSAGKADSFKTKALEYGDSS
jgi:hypothetical protein